MNYGSAYSSQLASNSKAVYELLDRKITELAELMLLDNSNQDLKSSYQIELSQATSIRKDDIGSYVANRLLGSNITGVLASFVYMDVNGGTIVVMVEPLTG